MYIWSAHTWQVNHPHQRCLLRTWCGACSGTPQVNARYSKLQIALDGVYKVILLLKKKKYAAIKFETGPDGLEREVRTL